ncbi:MAG: YhdP family protein [Rhodocyclaceae bacterium]|nr:YhdP family protein [Rhodocyclaceae bacterium]
MLAPTFLSNSIFRTTLAWTGRLLLVLYFAAAALILVGRHFLMPEIAGQRVLIEQKLSAAIGLPVTLVAFTATWPGLHPHLSIDGLRIHDKEGRPALAFDRVEAEIGWSSLLHFELRLHLLEIVAPQLDMRRDTSGTVFIAGLPVRQEGDSGFADWLLEQSRIVVRDARIVWHDEQRAAPPLELRHLNFELRNFGRHHSFGLTAEPSTEVAARLDLRGNLTGRNSADLAAWQGELFAHIEQLDLSAWAPWIALPLEMTRGKGGLRLWLNFANLMPTGFTADVHLTEMTVRLQPDLPPLALGRIDGRVAGRRTADGYSGEIRHLALTTAGGIEVQPTDVSLRFATTGRRAGGEFRADGLDLAALAGLADHFPLPDEWRNRLRNYAPRGRLSDLNLVWEGKIEAPDHWQVRGAFDALALAAQRELPGFSGISGRLEGNEKAGQVHFASRNATLDLPAVFPEPTLALANLEAEIGWRTKAGATDILLQRAVFVNADAKGEAAGSYRYTGQGLGEIDLSAKLTDAAGNAVWRYMPLVVNKDARDWLRTSIVGGRSDNTSLRLKGPLAKFPFRDGKSGIFQVKGTFQGATLDYAPGWPGITDIDGELLFEGVRMLIRGQRAAIMGVALAEVRAEIVDLEKPEEILIVTGRAKGETQRFLDFIEASPVGKRIDHFTETMAATGDGDLDLKLVLPLRHLVDTQVQGRYRFAGNNLRVLPELPPLTAAQGEFSFTADRLQAKGLKAQLLGMPLGVEMASAPGGVVRVNVTGTTTAQALRQEYGLRALDHLAGEAVWRGTVTVKKPAAEVRIESSLEGFSSSLPEPFNKSIRAAMPLVVSGRIEPQRDAWTIALGESAALRLQQAGENWRGRLALGAAAVKLAPALPTQGVALAIAVPQLDIDAWRKLFDSGENGENKAGPNLSLVAIDIRSDDVHVMRRHFHDVQLQGTRSDKRWRFGLDSREAQGQVTWDGAGAGRIVARLARLTLPAVDAGAPEPEAPDASREMPAIDLVIDNFRQGDLAFGEVKVKAENREGAWQAKLEVKNDAAKLTGEGRWRPGRPGLGGPETALSFKLDIDNAEKLLDRLGMPDAVRRGDGQIEGDVSWAGTPFAFDLPSLSGRVKADIGRGQFKKLEPGVGRLLGVLSLQSLPRRITLDFRDIFSEGFAFDSIAGEAKIGKGVMTTEELRIRGPSAKVLLSGQVDLAAETQNLKVRVQPALGESIAVGAMIVNPVAGAVAWAAQKVLGDPLDQIFAFEYAVTGGWNDPKVEKLTRKLSEQTTTVP